MRASRAGRLLDVAGEHDRGGRRAADHRGVRALERDRLEVGVERLREDDERAAVVARDDAEDDRAVEVDDRAADLGAVLELQLAHRLRRAVEAGEVGQHDERAAAAGGVDRARDLLRRLAGTACPRVHCSGPSAGIGAVARQRPRLDAEQRTPASRRGGRPRRPRSRPRASRPSARAAGGRRRSTARITVRMSNGFLRSGLRRRRRRCRRPSRGRSRARACGEARRRGRPGRWSAARRGKRSPGAT